MQKRKRKEKENMHTGKMNHTYYHHTGLAMLVS